MIESFILLLTSNIFHTKAKDLMLYHVELRLDKFTFHKSSQTLE